MKNQRGEIATLLTLISIGLMLMGVVVGNVAVQQTTRTQSKAGNCPLGYWECAIKCLGPENGKPFGSTDDDRNLLGQETFNNTYCDGQSMWKWQAAGNNASCGGVEQKKKAEGCGSTLPTAKKKCSSQKKCESFIGSKMLSLKKDDIDVDKTVYDDFSSTDCFYSDTDEQGFCEGECLLTPGEVTPLDNYCSKLSDTLICAKSSCNNIIDWLKSNGLSESDIKKEKPLFSKKSKWWDISNCQEGKEITSEYLLNYCKKNPGPPPSSTKDYQAQGLIKNKGTGKLSELKIKLWVDATDLTYESGYDGINNDGSFTASTKVKGYTPEDVQCFIGITPIEDDNNIIYSGPFFQCSEDTSNLNINIDYSLGTYLSTPCNQFAAKQGHTQADCRNVNNNSCKPDNYWYNCIPGGVCPYDNRVGLGYPFRCFADKTSYNMNTAGECTWACSGPSQPPLKQNNRCLSDEQTDKGRVPLDDGTVINKCVRRHCVNDPNRNNKTYYINIIEACKNGGVYEGPGTFTDIPCDIPTKTEVTSDCTGTLQITPVPSVADDKRVPAKGSPTTDSCQELISDCPKNSKNLFKKDNKFYIDSCNDPKTSKDTAWAACGITQCEFGGGQCVNAISDCKSPSVTETDKRYDCSNVCCQPEGKLKYPDLNPRNPTAPSTGTTTVTGNGCSITVPPKKSIDEKFDVTTSVTESANNGATSTKIIFRKGGSDTTFDADLISGTNNQWESKNKSLPKTGEYSVILKFTPPNTTTAKECDPGTKINITDSGSGAVSAPQCPIIGLMLSGDCAKCLNDDYLGKAAENLKIDSCGLNQKVTLWCKQGSDNKTVCTTKAPICTTAGKVCTPDDRGFLNNLLLTTQSYSNDEYQTVIGGIKVGKINAIDASLYVLNATRVPGLQRLFCDPLLGQCDFYYQNPQVGT